MALLLHPACPLWFVERLKWGWPVEQRLAGDLRVLLNHTDRLGIAHQPASNSDPSPGRGYSRFQDLNGDYNTQPRSGQSQSKPAVDNGAKTRASTWFAAPRGVRRGQSSDRDGELVTERLDEWLWFVLGRINIHDWKHRLAHVPEEYERLGKQLFVWATLCVCVCVFGCSLIPMENMKNGNCLYKEHPRREIQSI